MVVMNTTIDQTLSDLLEGVASLPPVAARILSLTTREDCSLDELARVIACDAPMALRFMALANSAALFATTPVRTVREALVRLGLRRTRDIALLMGMHDLAPSTGYYGDIPAVEYWRFTLAVAAAGSAMARSEEHADPDDAWLAGLFLGLGVPILARQAPAALSAARDLARAEALPLAEAVARILGFRHSQIAVRMMARWDFPAELTAAVSDACGAGDQTDFPLSRILQTAHGFVRHLRYGCCGDEDPVPAVEHLAQTMGRSGVELEILTRQVGRQVSHTAALIDLDLSPGDLGPALDQARQVAARIGLQGLEDALVRQELEQDSRRAREIQRRLLPVSSPDLAGHSLAAENLPGRRVSGDFYGYCPGPDGTLLLMIADIAGNGLPAAVLAGNVQACAQTLAKVVPDPNRLLAAVNQTLFESTADESFATMFLARLDPATGEVAYANAGHTPALLTDPAGGAKWLSGAAPPLGLLPGTRYPVHRETLEPGGCLVLYTDGITEIIDQREREFGRNNLAQVVEDHLSRTPAQLCRAILQAALAHAAGQSSPSAPARQHDDMTLVVLKRLSSPLGRQTV